MYNSANIMMMPNQTYWTQTMPLSNHCFRYLTHLLFPVVWMSVLI